MLDFDTKTYSCSDELHTMLNPHTKRFFSDCNEALLVHSDIFEEFCQILNDHDIRVNREKNTWEHTLRIAGREYPMYLVWIRDETQAHMQFIFDLLARSTYSFPWRLKEFIYQPHDRFHLVEEFVRIENLCKFIRKISIDTSLRYSSGDIKVIEFDELVPQKILRSFRKVLDANHIQFQCVYYVTGALSYLKPFYLEYLNIPHRYPDTITQVLLLLDYHRKMAAKGVEIFDLFDLIAMKLAIDDPRLEYENCEFHKLIDKLLGDMAEKRNYIESNTFNLVEYRSERTAWSRPKAIYQYFIYNFHKYFHSVINYSDRRTFKIKLSKMAHRVDALLDHMANCKNWLTLDIEENDLNENSADILMAIITSSKRRQNIPIKIVWDTDFKWYYSGRIPIDGSTIAHRLANITISFFGSNRHKFIENFLNWIKLLLGQYSVCLNLEFYQTEIFHPFIFTEFYSNEIIFRSTTLNCKLIDSMQRCHAKRVFITECRLENDFWIFRSLENMNRVWRIYLEHEEHTFSTIMKFIEQQLVAGQQCTTKRAEFQFRKDIRIPCFDYYDGVLTPNRLCLKDFVFYVNDERTKIEAYHMISGKNVNLYDFLYLDKFNNVNRDFEHQHDFEFYQ